MRFASLQKIKPLEGAVIFLADSFDKRDSPTLRRLRLDLNAVKPIISVGYLVDH
jgi:hypothetical protein